MSYSQLVGNPSGIYPQSLTISLTANGVGLLRLGANVKYIAFNPVAPLLSTYQVVSATPTTTINVDRAYIGKVFSVVYQNNTSALFTILSGTASVTLSGNGYFGASDNPEFRRLWNLNG